MKNLIISTLILFALACSCQSRQTVNISQENVMAILANVSSNSGNQLEINSNTTENQTNQTHTNISINNAATKTNLWSWGKIPMGYGLDKNGTLTKLADQEWKPSI